MNKFTCICSDNCNNQCSEREESELLPCDEPEANMQVDMPEGKLCGDDLLVGMLSRVIYLVERILQLQEEVLTAIQDGEEEEY